MKISFFIGSMQRGGAERVISILANDYCRRGWDVDVVVLLNNKVEYDLDDRIHIEDLSRQGSGYLKNAAFWLISIRRYLKKQKPDKVISFVGRINALVLTAAQGLKLPIIISERNDPNRDGRGVLMQKYCNKIYRRAERIVFQNKYQQSCFCQELISRSVIIPNPIQVETVASEQRLHRIVSVGRLMPQKNQKMLIDAFFAIYKTHPEYILDIYGEGPLRESLQQQIDALGLTEAVTLHGNVSHVHRESANAEVFVLSSDYEGLSNALLEAMMMGLPCITTNYPGVEEIIQDGENGLLVPCGDVSALAETISGLLEDSKRMDNLTCNARETSKAYCVDVVLEMWHKAIGME